MYKANIEANMLDADTAEWLSTESSWLEAQWPECRQLASDAGKNVTGDPTFVKYTFLRDVVDGKLYNFEFDVPTSN